MFGFKKKMKLPETRRHPVLGCITKSRGVKYKDGGSKVWVTQNGERYVELNQINGEHNGRFVTYESFHKKPYIYVEENKIKHSKESQDE